MRVLFTTMQGAGHRQPHGILDQALTAAGHEVAAAGLAPAPTQGERRGVRGVALRPWSKGWVGMGRARRPLRTRGAASGGVASGGATTGSGNGGTMAHPADCLDQSPGATELLAQVVDVRVHGVGRHRHAERPRLVQELVA